MKIGIIGLGNIGYSISQGLTKSGLGGSIVAYDHNQHALKRAKNDFQNIQFSDCIENIFTYSEVILICIRTAQIEEFLSLNSKYFIEGKSVVFLSAGEKIDFIKKLLKESKAILLRAITNVNVSSRLGYTFVLKSKNEEANKLLLELFGKLGKVNEVDSENQLDLLSLLSGCTPAIIALFFESLVESGVAIGVSKMQTTEIIEDTIHQTLKTLKDNNLSACELKQSVCTPGGIVEAQLRALENETDFKNDVVSWLPKILATASK